MFKGRYDHAVDGKGRTSLPARFREVLGSLQDDRLVLTAAFDEEFPHIVAYPHSEWRKFEEKLAQKPSFDPNVIVLKRLYVSNAVECQIDGHGRILVPPFLREQAGIAREATWLGMVTTVEIWQPERWARAYEQARDRIRDVRPGLADLDL
jgi:MraZ protein